MQGRVPAGVLLLLLAMAPTACGSSTPGGDAAPAVDAAADADVVDPADTVVTDAQDVSGDSGGATDVDGPGGFFIVGDIDGQTWLATHNIVPVENSFLFEVATVEPVPPSREWQLNFTLPATPFPFTLECVGNYIEFHELGLIPERRFVSRTATSSCEVTFVEPAVAGTIEGTFTATLTLRGTSMDYRVTNGRFRLPLAP